MAVGHGNHLAGRGDRTQRIGHMGERDDFGTGIQQFLVLLQNDLSGVVHRGNAQDCTLLGAQLLPRHNVGMVFQPSDDNLVILD